LTLIIGKQCNNGVLLVADSVSIAIDGGPPNNNAIKSLHGLTGDRAYSLVFGGHAGFVGGTMTLDVIRQAICDSAGLLQEDIRNAIREQLIDEVTNGDWNDANGKVDEAARDRFSNQRVTVFLTLSRDEWWIIDVTANTQNYFARFPAPRMAIIQPGPNAAAFDELKSLCDNEPKSLLQASKTSGILFQRATELFPNEVLYPGTALIHLANGIKEISFSNADELSVAVARYAP